MAFGRLPRGVGVGEAVRLEHEDVLCCKVFTLGFSLG